MNEKLDATNG